MALSNDLSSGDDDRQRAPYALLRSVRAGGASALAHILIQAQAGDRAASEMRVTDLAAALPDPSWLEARDVLQIVGVRESARVRDLTTAQRVCLVEAFCQFPVRPMV